MRKVKVFGLCSLLLVAGTLMAQTTGYISGHEWVDLGLSVKWATCNVGADSPSDYGNYYAWGETEPKAQYRESNSVTYGRKMKNIAEKSKYDAARANWGGTWRLPTEKEIDELINKCTCKWANQDGHNGYLMTGPNGNSIFLPAAGWWSWDESDGEEEAGGCWGDAPTRDAPDGACSLSFDSEDIGRYVEDRFLGQPVRPVTD